jgi:Flp pilus assembly protein TadD
VDPFSALAHQAMGEALLATGRSSEAESHFKEAHELDPAFGEAP